MARPPRRLLPSLLRLRLLLLLPLLLIFPARYSEPSIGVPAEA